MKEKISLLLQEALFQCVGEEGIPLLERPKNPDHGDYAYSGGLALARARKEDPRALAKKIIENLPSSPYVESAEVAGPGYVNIHLSAAAHAEAVREVLKEQKRFGHKPPTGKKVLAEFVSANPTGPLHIGHGRGAALGATVVNLLQTQGFSVEKEYYLNDAGRQIQILAFSTWLRIMEAKGFLKGLPDGVYKGDYVREMAHAYLAKDPASWLPPPQTLLQAISAEVLEEKKEAHLDALVAAAKDFLGPRFALLVEHCIEAQTQSIRLDLERFRVTFDHWVSERRLYGEGAVKKAVLRLQEKGHVFEADGALWFRATAFGDEKDRVLVRHGGEPTYFAADLAYHLQKYERGFDVLLNFWGADHHGYAPRLKGGLTALGLDAQKLEILFVQFVSLFRGKERVSMSTREGEFTPLSSLVEEVGVDAARFFYCLRKADHPLDFDLDLARARRLENPVFYVQYAHARIESIFSKWGEDKEALRKKEIFLPFGEVEKTLTSKIIEYPETLEAAAKERAPHLLVQYLISFARAFHSAYDTIPVLTSGEATLPRLMLFEAVRQVIENGLAILGVDAPKEM